MKLRQQVFLRAILLVCMVANLLGLAAWPLAGGVAAQSAQMLGPNAIRSGFDQNVLDRGDDRPSSPETDLGFTIDFFGREYTTVYVNQNSNITFGGAYSGYSGSGIVALGQVIVASFFADADTRNEATNPTTYGTGTVDGHRAFAANYRGIGPYNQGATLNYYQIVVIEREDVAPGAFDIELNYDQILWDRGGAILGYSNGTGACGTYYQFPGANVGGYYLDSNDTTGLIHNSLHSEQDGRYVLQVREGTVIVGNPPTVSAGDDATIDEAGSFTSTGQITDPDSSCFTASTVDYGNGSGAQSLTVAGNGSFDLSHQYADNGSYTVTVSVTDNGGNTVTDTAVVTVNNVAPTADLGVDPSELDEGGTITVNLTNAADVAAPDTTAGFTYAFDCGTGTFGVASATASTTCTAIDNPSQTIRARVIDKDNGARDYSATIDVTNVPPTATFNTPSGSVAEGSAFQLALSAVSDVPADTPTLQFAFDCGDGAGYGTFGSSSTASCTPDDNGTRTVKAKVRDKDGGESEYTGTVTVTNVVPTATFSRPSGTVAEGDSFTLALNGATDPSTADVTAGLTYAFDCGTGYGAASATASANCPTTDNGSRAVRAKVFDKDGGSTEYTGTVTVTNVTPTAALEVPSSAVAERATFTVSVVSPSDPSSADTTAGLTYAFDCGSGSYSVAAASNTATCTANDNPGQTVRAKIIDKDGGENAYTSTVTVTNVAPTATFVATESIGVGGPINLALTAPQDGATDLASLEYAFDCGDGNGSGTFGSAASTSCPTSETGTRTVKGTVRDKDGGSTEYTATAEIVPLTATELTVAPASGTYGGTVALSATLTADSQPLSGKQVALSLNGTALGSFATNAQGQVTLNSASLAGIAAGNYPAGIVATFDGQIGQYAGSTNSAALTVAKATQTINFPVIATKTTASPPFTLDAKAGSDLAVTYVATGDCTIAGAVVTVTGIGSCTVTASQGGDANYLPAEDVSRTFSIVNAIPNHTLTVQVVGNGEVAISPTGTTHPENTVIELRATPGNNALFIGWQIDDEQAGWANPLTLTLDASHTIKAIFAPDPSFGDTADNPYAVAIDQLAARGVIVGYSAQGCRAAGVATPCFGPGNPLLRAEVALMIVRAMGWSGEEAGAASFFDIGMLNPALQDAIKILAGRGVIFGYGNGRFGPLDKVENYQVVLMISRAMVDQGYWTLQDDNAAIYGNIPGLSPNATPQERMARRYLATYVNYAGALPNRPTNQTWNDWTAYASRGWTAQVIWQAMSSYLGTDHTP